MTRYASRTEVTPERSRAEIERVVTRYGATGFHYGWQGETAAIGFEIGGRRVRIVLSLPSLGDFKFDDRSYLRSATAQKREHEQAVRQRWRALVLVLKAKLEAVESGISTIEREFLADVVLSSGETVGEWLAPQIEAAYRAHEMPPLLPGLPSPASGSVRLHEVV